MPPQITNNGQATEENQPAIDAQQPANDENYPRNDPESPRRSQFAANAQLFIDSAKYMLLAICIITIMHVLNTYHRYLLTDMASKNLNNVPLYFQKSFMEPDINKYWAAELKNIEGKGFYTENGCYRFKIIKGRTKHFITINNELKPIGSFEFREDTSKSSGKSDFIKYVEGLFKTEDQFIIEFRKLSNVLIFYRSKETLLFDRVFPLKRTKFVGLKVREYFKNKFNKFLTDLDNQIDMRYKEKMTLKDSQTNEIMKFLVLMAYYGALDGVNIRFSSDCLCILSKDLELFIVRDFRDILAETFEKMTLSTMEGKEISTPTLIFLKSIIGSIKTKQFYIYFDIVDSFNIRAFLHEFKNGKFYSVCCCTIYQKLGFFAVIHQNWKRFISSFKEKSPSNIYKAVCKHRMICYEKEWKDALKNSNKQERNRRIVESYYNTPIGTESFDEKFFISKNYGKMNIEQINNLFDDQVTIKTYCIYTFLDGVQSDFDNIEPQLVISGQLVR